MPRVSVAVTLPGTDEAMNAVMAPYPPTPAPEQPRIFEGPAIGAEVDLCAGCVFFPPMTKGFALRVYKAQQAGAVAAVLTQAVLADDDSSLSPDVAAAFASELEHTVLWTLPTVITATEFSSGTAKVLLSPRATAPVAHADDDAEQDSNQNPSADNLTPFQLRKLNAAVRKRVAPLSWMTAEEASKLGKPWEPTDGNLGERSKVNAWFLLCSNYSMIVNPEEEAGIGSALCLFSPSLFTTERSRRQMPPRRMRLYGLHRWCSVLALILLVGPACTA